MTRFTHCVVYFCETKHYSVLDRRTINEKITVGKNIFIDFPVRKEPFEAIVRALCETKIEAENKVKLFSENGIEDSNNGNEIQNDEENHRSCSWSPEPLLKDDQQSQQPQQPSSNSGGGGGGSDEPKNCNNHQNNNNINNNNYVTSDLFCDVMNRVVEVLQGIQTNSDKNLKDCIKEMTKINQNLLISVVSGGVGDGDSETIIDRNNEIEEEEEGNNSNETEEIPNQVKERTQKSTTTKISATSIPSTKIAAANKAPQKTPTTTNLNMPQQQSKNHQRSQQSVVSSLNPRMSGWSTSHHHPLIPPPPPPSALNPAIAQSNIFFEDDIGGPSWEFVSREKVDEVFEDCENYKIFARKISYAIFDLDEQKLKMNERNKKKVSELRKIIKLKYPSERREFDDMIWRTCKNAVNNTTYNEAKRRKRHPALMLGTESAGQNFLASNYDYQEMTPSKKPYDVPGQQESFFKAEPRSEMDL